MDTQRLILLFIFGFSVLMLWENWQRERAPKPPPAAVQQPGVPSSPAAKPAAPVAPAAPGSIAAPAAGAPAATGETIRVSTDLVVAEIDTLGATLKRLELLRAPGKDGVEAEKVYTFRRNSYVIDVQLHVQNRGSGPIASYAYFQLTHDG